MPHKFSLSHVFLLSGDEKPEKAVVPTNDVPDSVATVSTPYRLYKRRFVGLFGMVSSASFQLVSVLTQVAWSLY